MDKNLRFSKTDNLLVQKIDGAYLVMNPISDESVAVYISNVAIYIFNMCDGTKTVEQMCSFLTEKYNVEYDVCRNDVLDTLNTFVRELIIKEVE